MTFAASGLTAAEIAALAAEAQAAAAAAAAAGTTAATVAAPVATTAAEVIPAATTLAEVAPAAAGTGEVAAGSGTIAGDLGTIANGAQAQTLGTAATPAVETATPAAAQAATPAATPATTPPAPMENLGAASNVGQAQDAGVVNVQAGADSAASPANSSAIPSSAEAGATGGSSTGSLADTLQEYAKSAAKEMLSPKTLVPAALSGGGALWQQHELSAEQERQKKFADESMAQTRAAGDKINSSVNKWASENLNPTAMQANQDAAYGDLTGSYDQYLSSANRNGSGVAGNVSSDFTRSMADGMTGAAQKAADYARKMAKTQAPAFANLKTNLGELAMQRDVGNALSDANSAGALGRAGMSTVNGSTGMLGAAALRGLGQAAGSKL